jgi:hypothetical protein
MTTITKLAKNRYLLGAPLALGLAVGLIFVGRSYDLTKSDWGAWVGSVGTVLTLIGTIWLATTAERRSRREKLDLAIIAAANLTPWIGHVNHVLDSIRSILPGALAADDDPKIAAADCIERLEALGIWQQEDLAPLVFIGNNFAARLSWTTIRIRHLASSLRRVSTSDNINHDVVQQFNITLDSQLKECTAELTTLQEECMLFLANHGFRPRHPGI